MIKSKYISIIAAVAIIAAILFTILFSSGTISVFSPASANPEYADKLFDTSYVHQISIEADPDEWQDMLDNARAEEYIACNITIDGTRLNNVGIRPKGNTSLSNVESMDSDRYSFKVEFDQYDNLNYMGLDKLCLNNVIQDNTYMKDYFSYRIMQEAGAAAPLCSFAYITVNGEEFGLYLAVEAIEESFAKRNYGNDYGQIYKPESMGVGGENRQDGEMPAGKPEFGGNRPRGEMPQMPEGGFEPPNADGAEQPNKGEMPIMPPGGMQPPETNMTEPADNTEPPQGNGGRMRGGFGDRNSNVVALVYQDDNADSYQSIFDYAVFNPDTADKKRLIEAIRQLNQAENIESAVDIDSVVRYFAAHNFTVNFDSYTGNMMHNYYLYEKDGVLSMIPWDYNLAFGSFGGGGRGGNSSATSYVNYPIDTPLSGASNEDRPMIGRILESEEYTGLYHEAMEKLIAEYFESGKFEAEFNATYGIILEYVQRDPTKFCTFEEFVKGAETLKQFCLLRAESVKGQLDGTIPATTDGQAADTSKLIDASEINIGDMGSMGAGGGKGEGRQMPQGEGQQFDREPTAPDRQMQEGGQERDNPQAQNQAPNGQPAEQPAFNNTGRPSFGGQGGRPQGEIPAMQRTQSTDHDYTSFIILGGCIILMIFGITFAFLYKKKR